MTPEKILEIARRYTAPVEESSLLVEYDGDVPVPTGEMLNLMMWNFCEEELIAFARSVIEADRESSDEPVGYLTYIEDAGLLFSQDDPESGCYEPLYSRPAPSRNPLSDDEINDCFDIVQKNLLKYQSGVKGQQLDIRDWHNWHFARVIEKAHGIGDTK